MRHDQHHKTVPCTRVDNRVSEARSHHKLNASVVMARAIQHGVSPRQHGVSPRVAKCACLSTCSDDFDRRQNLPRHLATLDRHGVAAIETDNSQQDAAMVRTPNAASQRVDHAHPTWHYRAYPHQHPGHGRAPSRQATTMVLADAYVPERSRLGGDHDDEIKTSTPPEPSNAVALPPSSKRQANVSKVKT